jgi:L-fuculose-phosphate aldolase
MANHGCVALGATLDAAVQNALLVEWLCELHWHANVLGRPRVLTDEQQQSVLEAAARMGYGTTRKAER